MRRFGGYDVCPFGKFVSNGLLHCAACDPDPIRARKFRRAEFRFFESLAKAGLVVTQTEVVVEFGCEAREKAEAKSARLDGIIDRPDIRIVVELDEHFHEHYEPLCEASRQAAATFAMRVNGEERPIAWVRVNPHAIPDTDQRDSIPFERKRHAEAIEMIRGLLQNPRDCVLYVNYPDCRVAELESAYLCV